MLNRSSGNSSTSNTVSATHKHTRINMRIRWKRWIQMWIEIWNWNREKHTERHTAPQCNACEWEWEIIHQHMFYSVENLSTAMLFWPIPICREQRQAFESRIKKFPTFFRMVHSETNIDTAANTQTHTHTHKVSNNNPMDLKYSINSALLAGTRIFNMLKIGKNWLLTFVIWLKCWFFSSFLFWW